VPHTPEQLVAQEAVLDAAAAHCARTGDASAFEGLVRKYHTRVEHFVRRRGVGAGDVEDLAQETFLRAWRSISAFDPGGRARFSTWLFTIASRVASTHLRDARTAERALRSIMPTAAACAQEKVAACDVDLWGLADRVLGPETRSALWLRYAEDLSPEEIAHVLQRSGVSVRVMLMRGRARLAKELASAEKFATVMEGCAGLEGLAAKSGKPGVERCHA